MENAPSLDRERLAMLAGGSVALLGAIVMIGWWTDTRLLVQVLPVFVPMQFNTALGFLLVGLSVVALSRHWTRTGRAMAGAGVAIGALTGLQYLLGVDLGIDELFMNHHVTVATSHPGRMAPNTALCFVLAGSAGLLMAGPRIGRIRCVSAEVLGSLTAGLAMVSLFGYATGIETAYGWGMMTHMAVHTAAGFLVLGTAMLLGAWLTDDHERGVSVHWLILPAGVASAAILISLSQVLAQDERARITEATSLQSTFLADTVELHLESYLLSLERIARYATDETVTPEEEWNAIVTSYIADHPGFRFVALIDENHDYLRAAAADDISLYYRVLDVSPVPRLSQAAGEAVIVRSLAVDDSDALVLAAVRATNDRRLLAIIDPVSLAPSVAATKAIYDFRLESTNERLLGSGSPLVEDDWTLETDVGIRNAGWTLLLRPTDAHLDTLRTPLTGVVLAGGVLGMLLLLVVIHFAQLANHRARAVTELNRELRESQHGLERLAHYDELTALGNRNRFMLRLDELLETAEAGNRGAGILFMDLDGFKSVNDELGHKAGDTVLQEVATRIPTLLRKGDEMFRLGGDEFAVLLRPGTSEEGAMAMAQKMQDLMLTPVMLYEDFRTVGLSIGVAMYPQHGKSREVLIRQADVAMYQSKQTGKPAAASVDVRATTALRALQGGKEPVKDPAERRSARGT